MKKNRLIAFALSVSLLLGASACGKPAKTCLLYTSDAADEFRTV